MSQRPIPEAWRLAVCAALKSGSPARAKFTEYGRKEWQNDFHRAYRFELEQAFIEALSLPHITGCHVTLSHPPGETWEFYFTYEGTRTYGKILLRPDQESIVILSAHRPHKGKLSCE